jgi:hypothetical protein
MKINRRLLLLEDPNPVAPPVSAYSIVELMTAYESLNSSVSGATAAAPVKNFGIAKHFGGISSRTRFRG